MSTLFVYPSNSRRSPKRHYVKKQSNSTKSQHSYPDDDDYDSYDNYQMEQYEAYTRHPASHRRRRFAPRHFRVRKNVSPRHRKYYRNKHYQDRFKSYGHSRYQSPSYSSQNSRYYDHDYSHSSYTNSRRNRHSSYLPPPRYYSPSSSSNNSFIASNRNNHTEDDEQYIELTPTPSFPSSVPSESLEPESSVPSTTHSMSIPPPPKLYFPLNECLTPRLSENNDPAKTERSFTANPADSNRNGKYEGYEDDAGDADDAESNVAGLMDLASAPPLPLSALKTTDGLLNLKVEDLPTLSRLNITKIQEILEKQRLKNEKIIAKLHEDKKTFVRVCQHYDKKIDRLTHEIEEFEENNKSVVDEAEAMVQLLGEHKMEAQRHGEEERKFNMARRELMEGYQKNGKLLGEVNLYNRQVDVYHAMIAKLNHIRNVQNAKEALVESLKDKVTAGDDGRDNGRKKGGVAGWNSFDDDSKDELEQEPVVNQVNDGKVVKVASDIDGGRKVKAVGDIDDDDDRKEKEVVAFDTMSVMSMGSAIVSDIGRTEMDPVKKMAKILVAKNKHYKSLLSVLRTKVDELRTYRKKL